MAINERSINDNLFTTNKSNDSFFSFIVIVTCRSNDNTFSNSPINRIENGQFILSSDDFSIQRCPSIISFLSIHCEFTFKTSNTFVTEHWLLGLPNISVHDECQFVLIREFFGTCNELTTIQSDKLRAHDHIDCIGKFDCTLLNDNTSKDRSRNINK